MMKKLLFLALQFISLCSLAQNTGNNSAYNPQDFYLPSFNPPAGSVFRSAKGTPGPMYWQNKADYLIHATLNEKDTSITGDVTISYTNNSPDKLDYLWLQLDQNLFEPASRGTLTTPVSGVRFDSKGFRGGFHIADIAVTYNGKTYKVQPVITDTRMQVRLNSPMLPKGGKVSVKINFSIS